MKKRLKLLGLALGVAALMALTTGGTVFADTPEETDDQDYCAGYGWHGFLGEGNVCSDTVSELLGLTTDELCDLRQEGKSLAEIAAAQGVTEDTLVEAILAAKKEAIQEKVEAGILTQEQSDRMFQQMEQRTIEAVNRTTVGPVGPHEDRGAGAMRYGVSQGGHGSFDDDTELGTGPGLM